MVRGVRGRWHFFLERNAGRGVGDVRDVGDVGDVGERSLDIKAPNRPLVARQSQYAWARRHEGRAWDCYTDSELVRGVRTDDGGDGTSH